MKKTLLLALFLLFSAAATFAQVTTSSMTGLIKDDRNEVLIGATVKATHVPTGSNYVTTTNSEGRFLMSNMRVGGPYTVVISYVGFKTETVTDLVLTLGQPLTVNYTLKGNGTELSAVTVTGTTASRVLNGSRQGALTNLNTREIAAIPTVGRSVNDLTRLTPQASSTSQGAIGGGNYRQNNFTVDGANFNNQFGIGGNLPAGGAPISLDAIGEISVNVTPFDVRQSGFIGSAINAVTKSGTNQVTGSIYGYYRNESMQGSHVKDNAKIVKQDLSQKTYGFSLGGPIIKNKLFLFLNAERYTNDYPGQTNFAATAARGYNTANPDVRRPTADQLTTYSNYLRTTYGYETGAFDNYAFRDENTKILARLDWNINDYNKFTVRYSQVESTSPSFVSTSRSPLTNYAQSTGRTSQTALQFQNSNYGQDQNLYSIAAELNSNFTMFGRKVSNTLRGTWTHQNDPRSSNSSVFPFVDILAPNGSDLNVPLTSFGYEPFTYGNLRDVKTYSFIDNLTWNIGKHNFTFGAQADFSTTTNGFQRFGTSYYTFASWDDFVGGKKPVDFAVTFPLNQGFNQVFPTFKFAQYAGYFQDEINVSDRFKVTPGLRLDLATYPGVDQIKTHPLVASLLFNGGQFMNTGLLPTPRIMPSPRIGFNYDVFGNRSLQVRGGTGIFTGQVPFVWIVAQSGDSGLLQFTQTYETPSANNGRATANSANFVTPGPFNVNPFAYVDPNAYQKIGTSVPSAISAISPKFKNPQQWKSTLAVDAKLPFGIVGTIEGIYGKDLNIAKGENINLVDPTPLNVAGYPDNRPIYPSTVSSKFINPLTAAASATPNIPVRNGAANGTQALNAIMLKNASQGYYWSVTGKLDKQFSKGFFGSVAYTKSQAKNLYDGSGDQLINTWSGTQIVNNANSPELASASYVVPDRLIAYISYRKEYLKHLGTTLSLFYEGSIAGRFSYTYSSDFNRDGQTNDLMYIPRNPSEITFVDNVVGTGANAVTYKAADQSDAFFKYIAQDEYLSKHQGEYATRNGAKIPWRSQFDFKFAQDLFVNVGGKRNTIQFTADILNVGNLLNKNWGTYKLVNVSSLLAPANASSLVAGGTVKPTFRLNLDRNGLPTSTFRDNNTTTSTYYMQLGLRYIFN